MDGREGSGRSGAEKPGDRLDALILEALAAPPLGEGGLGRIRAGVLGRTGRRSARISPWLWLIPAALTGALTTAVWLLGQLGVPVGSIAGALLDGFAAVTALAGSLGGVVLVPIIVAALAANVALVTWFRSEART